MLAYAGGVGLGCLPRISCCGGAACLAKLGKTSTGGAEAFCLHTKMRSNAAFQVAECNDLTLLVLFLRT